MRERRGSGRILKTNQAIEGQTIELSCKETDLTISKTYCVMEDFFPYGDDGINSFMKS